MITSTITYIGLLTMTEWLKVNAVAIILAVTAMFGSYSAQQVQLGKMEVRVDILEVAHEDIQTYKEDFITLKSEVSRMKSDIAEFNNTVRGLNQTLSNLDKTLTKFEVTSGNTKEKLDELQDTQKTILQDVQAIKMKVR